MNVKIKKITLINFKGLKFQEVDFNTENITDILGDNATGKTTIFDAFCWAMFEKDSKDRKQFAIKTFDENGNTIPHLPHEVIVELLIDGIVTTITKKYIENWVTKRGSKEAEFSGHEVKRFINDVPYSLDEYSKKIGSIINEDDFKLLTIPTFFMSQKEEWQRQQLFGLAGNLTDEDVVEAYPQYKDLISKLNRNTIEEYKRALAASIKKIKAEMTNIPIRIEEVKRAVPEAQDWDSIRNEITEKQNKITVIDGQLSDKNNVVIAQQNERKNLIQEKGKLEEEKISLENEIKQEALKDYNLRQEEIQTKKDKIATLEKDNVTLTSNLNYAKQKNISLNEKLKSLEKQYIETKAKAISFNEDDYICPTCGAEFNQDKINELQQNAISNFNSKKAKDLETITADGLKLNKEIDEVESNIKDYTSKIEENKVAIASLQEFLNSNVDNEAKPDVDSFIANNPRIIEINKKIINIDLELEKETSNDVNDFELKEQKQTLAKEVEELQHTLYDEEIIEQSTKRIQELEKQLKAQGQEKAKLEKEEFEILNFNKSKIQMIENKINSYFSIVRFKMFETQINGAEIETCKVMINGSYELNSAGVINAGLDIINAFAKHKNLYAPVFIDNAEGVNELLPIQSQLIRLVVSPKIYKCSKCGTEYSHTQEVCVKCNCTEFKDITPKTLIIK